jgi:hypothetical protein
MAYSRFAAQECVCALVRRHQPRRAMPHKDTAPVRMRRVPPKTPCYYRVEPAPESPHRQTRWHVNTRIAQAQRRNRGRNRYRGARVQRLEVLVAVMLARERRYPANIAADGCTELAAALASLPSRPLEMIAEAVAALGCADA